MATKTAKKQATKTEEKSSAIVEATKGTFKAPIPVKKITPKDAIGSPTQAEMRKNEYSFTLSGRVSSSEIVTTQYGDSIRFKGAFMAETEPFGVITSNQAFLPSVLESMLQDALLNSMEKDSKANVKFAFKIYTQLSDKGTFGYEWFCQPLVEFEDSTNELALLLKGESEE